MSLRTKLWTVFIFTKLSFRRFFRDRLSIFFSIMFPLIFLFVFGSLSKGSDDISFRVALINQSQSEFSQDFAKKLKEGETFKVDEEASNSREVADEKLSRSQIDGIILLPENFGEVDPQKRIPTGSAKLIYSQTSSNTGQTLTTVLDGVFRGINNNLTQSTPPLTVEGQQLNSRSLTAFDYTFAGLLGFSIIGLGIFGPVNVFPELKKQGILRRLHTTPIKVWQYFLANMNSQALIGMLAIAVQFVVAIVVFDLNVYGNIFEIALFSIFSIAMILGIGLSIGGWAKNERQAAPLSNIVVFPMLFLSGTFFPRFAMPEWLQKLSEYLPLTPVIDGLRMLITEGKHLIDLGPQIGLIALWMVVIYFIAFRVFRWE